MSAFPFLRNDEVATSHFDYVARVRAGITTKEDLFEELRAELAVPPAFGGNWDALDDRLSDLSWLRARRIAVVHEAVPHLPREELVTYLSILCECIDTHAEEGRTFVASFPNETRDLRDTWSGVKR